MLRPCAVYLVVGLVEALSLLLGDEVDEVLEALVTPELRQLVAMLHEADDGVHTETAVLHVH